MLAIYTQRWEYTECYIVTWLLDVNLLYLYPEHGVTNFKGSEELAYSYSTLSNLDSRSSFQKN